MKGSQRRNSRELWGKKVYITSQHAVMQGSQSRNSRHESRQDLEAGTEAGTMEE